MKKLDPKYLLLLPLALLLTAARAQSGLNTKDLQDISVDRFYSARSLNEANNQADLAEAAAQTPLYAYFDSDWQPGALLLIAGDRQPVEHLRLNLQLRLLEVQDATVPGGIRVYPPGSLRGFVLGGAPGHPAHEFRTQLFRSADGSGRDFLEVLTPGAVSLLLRHTLFQQTAERNAALSIETRPAGIFRNTALFATEPNRGGHLAVELALSRRPVLRLFGPQARDMATYAEQHQLDDFTKLANILNLVEHYNTAVAEVK